MRWMRGAFVSGLLCGPLAVCAQQPTTEYFQQKVDYSIDVMLDDVKHMLHASETITYTNRSTDALDTLWIHLYPNAYKQKGTALSTQQSLHGDLDLWFAKDEDRGFIDSLDFRVNGAPISWGLDEKHIDIAWLKLSEALSPNASVEITTPFRVKIPDARFSRLGHTGQAYYITQWYPKAAVYDREGWHAIPYLDQGEFFSDFGSFDVRITLPVNYVVGATGELQNADERQWMDELAAKNEGKGKKGGSMVFPLSAPNTKTLQYKQENVLDFAWFTDKRYLVENDHVDLPSGRKVETWTLYTPKHADTWNGSALFVSEAVKHYSKWVGDYPFSSCTAVDGTISAGGGMEYPMITVIGDMDGAMALDEVIAHEVGHNWFQGILASNEREHPWMDEGMNSFVELRYMRKRYPNQLSVIAEGIPKALFGGRSIGHREVSELAYRLNARRNLDQSCSLPSEEYTSTNYGTSVYMKTALVFDHLFAYLGDSLFDACMHEYYRRWAFKHPKPEDVRKAFEEVSGKDLTWAFTEELGAERKLDAVGTRLNGANIKVRTKGQRYAAPIPVTAWAGSDSLGTVWIDPSMIRFDEASAGNKRVTIDSHPSHTKWIRTETLPWPNATRVTIDAGHRTLDIDHRNNTVRSKGILRSWTPVRLKFLVGVEDPTKRTLYWTPIIAANVHDGFQAGLAFYNTVFPSQRTEFVIAPLYGFGSQRPVGAARIEHHFDRMRSSWFRNIHLGAGGRTATLSNDPKWQQWYERGSAHIKFDIKRPLAKPTQHSITLRGIYLRTNDRFDLLGGGTGYLSSDNWIGEFSYDGDHGHPLGPAHWTATATTGYDWARVSIEASKAFVYDERGHSVRLRAFAGSFLGVPGSIGPNQAWGLSWAAEDPFYDHAYIGRGETEGLWAQQFSKQQGAFKTGVWQGGSDSYIAAVNVELDFPMRVPIALFGSAGIVPVKSVATDGSKTEKPELLLEFGVGLPLVKDVFEIWMPLGFSKNITDELAFRNIQFGDRIRFVLALEKLDPTRIIRNLKP
ncbi:MAG: M1 family metallopeptidase [Flavobacteriales bacterium]|nr:M1 family metallopeptidase [Flavobacteriales bacterium]